MAKIGSRICLLHQFREPPTQSGVVKTKALAGFPRTPDSGTAFLETQLATSADLVFQCEGRSTDATGYLRRGRAMRCDSSPANRTQVVQRDLGREGGSLGKDSTTPKGRSAFSALTLRQCRAVSRFSRLSKPSHHSSK